MSAAESEKRFKKLLQDLFQFERADLNFGIYRVMNQKHEQMESFIGNDIVAAVNEALQDEATAHIAATDKEEISSWLRLMLGGDIAFDTRGKLKADFEKLPAGKIWKSLQGEDVVPIGGEEERRKEVFNALYTFFSRYYDDGDFMCKQRYAAHGRYAVPYNGEEVLLHWANKDQYYIKTAEYFPRYEYKPAAGTAALRFEIQTAELEQDNNKSGEKKYFLPLADKLQAPTKRDNAYILPFAYRPLTAAEQETYPSPTQSTNQDAIIQAALNALRTAPFAATEKGAERLEEHLKCYIRRNMADFFIHKNLRRFLRGELDYYINKELLNTEELLRNNANTRARFSVANALRAAADKTIDFLAQLEDYQKLIWEKKKFVTETHYAVRLSTISDNGLLDAVAANNAQWQEWEQLDFIPADAECKGKAQRRAFMKKHPTLTVDTAHFSDAFKMQWLETVEDLDDVTDGVLFHSENWQALNLMQEKYREKIRCVYIDPPYNTGNDSFLYKDNYKYASWMSMLHDRLAASCNVMHDEGVLFCSIGDLNPDEGASVYLQSLASNIFPKRFGNLIWRKRSSIGSFSEKDMTEIHEYILVYGNTNAYIYKNILSADRKKLFNEKDENNNYFRWMGIIGPTQQTKKRRPNLDYTVLVCGEEIVGFEYKDAGENVVADYFRDMRSTDTIKRITLGGTATWLFSKDIMKKFWNKNLLKVSAEDGANYKIEIKNYLINEDGTINGSILKSIISENDMKVGMNIEGTKTLRELFSSSADTEIKPKPPSLISFIVSTVTVSGEIVLDYFAGSGTTAHAVINLNREDDGKRKFILAEMGEHFNAVLLPRIKKVIFSPQWKDGKPARYATKEEINRAPRIIKYHCIESYDDALENIRFNDSIGEAMGLFDDYVPRYMLQAESAACASLAGDSAAFKRPFCYTLKKANDNDAAAVADLPETFAYLIGLQEKTRRTVCNGKKQYIIQSGIADNRKTMVIWRDTENWENADYEKERDFIAKQKLTADAERVYVNDDSLIPRAESLTPVITKKMFSSDDE